MAAPEVHPAVERLYLDLGRVFREGQEDLDYPLLRYLDAVWQAHGEIEDLVLEDEEGRPGWTILFDVDRCPAAFLPYLAQFVGVHFSGVLTEEEMRDRIREREGQQRGTPAALVAAIKRTLTGSQVVTLTERDTSAYHFKVRTYTIQTPSVSATEAALLRMKPAGLQYTLEVLDGVTFDELEAEFPGTFADLDAEFGTFDDQTDWVPV